MYLRSPDTGRTLVSACLGKSGGSLQNETKVARLARAHPQGHSHRRGVCVCVFVLSRNTPNVEACVLGVDPPPPSALLFYVLSRSRSARGARAELHAPKAPKSKAEMEAEAAAEELMAKHREVKLGNRGEIAFFFLVAERTCEVVGLTPLRLAWHSGAVPLSLVCPIGDGMLRKRVRCDVFTGCEYRYVALIIYLLFVVCVLPAYQPARRAVHRWWSGTTATPARPRRKRVGRTAARRPSPGAERKISSNDAGSRLR